MAEVVPRPLPGSEEAADAAPAAATTTTEVTLYTCPTGGWVMGNRKPMEEAIKKEIPGAVVKHKIGYPLTAAVEINGKRKREIGPFMFFCPACAGKNACCSAAKTGKNAAGG